MLGPVTSSELPDLARSLAAHVARRAYLGSPRLDRPAAPARSVPPPTPDPRSPAELATRTVVPAPPPTSPAPSAESATPVDAQRERAAACATLEALRGEVAGCQACALARTRTQTVFCDGPERARVMFVGEAPGQHEDEQGVPFVGAAGRLLTDIIVKGMGLARGEVHIANVLKCRPPGNRDPEPLEKALCTPFLDRQIELVDPEVLIPLGLHAAQHVLGSALSMGRLRGRVHAWRAPGGRPRKVVPTYHPAYLLRDPSKKKDCWQDIQLAMRELGLEPPGR